MLNRWDRTSYPGRSTAVGPNGRRKVERRPFRLASLPATARPRLSKPVEFIAQPSSAQLDRSIADDDLRRRSLSKMR
jgi:hypothetical protein